MPDKKVRIGVVGTGKMGAYHLQKYQQIEQAELVGLFDLDVSRATEIAAKFGVKRFDRLPDLLFEVDAVSIATPTATHFAVARQALESGVHVLVEKPIASSQEEAETMVQIARDRGLVLQVGLIERFRYAALTRGVPLTGVRYIEAHRLSPSLNREVSVDVVSDLMIHDLDLVLSLIGEDPCHVSAIGVPVVTSRYDIANVRLEFSNGAVVNLNASRVSPEAVRKLRLFSADAYLSLDFISNQVSVHRRNEKNGIEVSATEVTDLDALLEQSKEFIRCVASGAKPTVTGEDGLRALKYSNLILEKIEQRARLNSLVEPTNQNSTSLET